MRIKKLKTEIPLINTQCFDDVIDMLPVTISTRWGGNVKCLATVEPRMTFLQSNSPHGTLLQQTTCHTLMQTNDVLSDLFSRYHHCDHVNTVS